MAREAQLAIEHDFCPALVEVDPDRMRQLIDNVIGNSLRCSERGGRVRIGMTKQAQTPDVIFDDTPPGLDTELLGRLLGPLYRGLASRTRKHGGSSLGLAIAQRIVAANDGALHALGSPLSGMRIVLTLPNADMSHPQHLLIAADEPKIAALLSEYLQASGYLASIVDEGDRVLQAIGEKRPDVLLRTLLPAPGDEHHDRRRGHGGGRQPAE